MTDGGAEMRPGGRGAIYVGLRDVRRRWRHLEESRMTTTLYHDGLSCDLHDDEVELLSRLIVAAVMTPGRLTDRQIDEALALGSFPE